MFIKSFAINLFCRIHRRQLHYLACKFRQNGRNIVQFQFVYACPRLGLATSCPRPVARVRLKTEPYASLIFLDVSVEKLGQPRCLTDKDYHHAGRKRVERAGMTDPFCVQNAADASHDIVRRDPGRFIDYKDAIHQSILNYAEARALARAIRTLVSIE